jgi:TetR/AcrR family transcriptional regulator, transcriptional repressor for nem operon
VARPREFDPDTALDRAMQIFWSKGYYATSLNDLCEAMQLNRSSLYAEFGDKRALFVKAIDRYSERLVTSGATAFSRPVPIRKAVAGFFADMIEQIAAGPDRMGCFIGNTAAEVATHDRVVAARVRRSLDRLEAMFHDAFAKAMARGEIPQHSDIRALARFFVAGAQGLHLVGKTTKDRAVLEDIVEMILRALER